MQHLTGLRSLASAPEMVQEVRRAAVTLTASSHTPALGSNPPGGRLQPSPPPTGSDDSDTEEEPTHVRYKSSGSPAGDHINRSDNYRGVEFVEKWRIFRRKNPDVAPGLGGSSMFDDYKACFPNDYRMWKDDDSKLLTVR